MHTFPDNEGSSDVMVQLGDLLHNNAWKIITKYGLPWIQQDKLTTIKAFKLSLQVKELRLNNN